MKKTLMFVIATTLLLAFIVPGHSWTGRMAGMGNPYGLVEDESDFLTHPTAITQGKGWQYYGDFGLNYTKVMKWDMSRSYPTGAGFPESYGATGDEWANTGSFGFTFPVNTGRMGVFLDYAGNFLGREKYSGDGFYQYWPQFVHTFDAKRDYDFFRIRALYAQPFTDKVKFGGEFGISYKKETSNTTEITSPNPAAFYTYENFFKSWLTQNLYNYMIPVDSRYWETTLKASAEGIIGSSKINVSVFGGFILGGKNSYDYAMNNLGHVNWSTIFMGEPYTFGMNGNISGWNIGGEAWWRFTVNNTVSLPFVVRADYRERKREASGTIYNAFGGYASEYNQREKSFDVLAGGGVDYRISKACGIAVGLYYNYLLNEQSVSFSQRSPSAGFVWVFDYPDYPKATEHRILLRAAGEFALTPKAALTTGLSFFYGWARQDFNRMFYYDTSTISLDGHRWGLGLAVGGVFKFGSFTFEPYINGGFQRLDLSGDGNTVGMMYSPSSDDLKKNQWNIGGGFAIKFN